MSFLFGHSQNKSQINISCSNLSMVDAPEEGVGKGYKLPNKILLWGTNILLANVNGLPWACYVLSLKIPISQGKQQITSGYNC